MLSIEPRNVVPTSPDGEAALQVVALDAPGLALPSAVPLLSGRSRPVGMTRMIRGPKAPSAMTAFVVPAGSRSMVLIVIALEGEAS